MEFRLRKGIPSKYLKKKPTKLRLSSHALAIETEINNKTDENDRKCCNCSDYVESEFHFILVCPKYYDYRLRFLKKYYREKLYNSEIFCKIVKF